MAKQRKPKNQAVVTLEFLDSEGSESMVKQSLTGSDIDRHSHLGSILASAILQIEHGDPEAFCRILVATFGSGRKFLVDTLGSAANDKIILRFADLLDQAEKLNDIDDIDKSTTQDKKDPDDDW